VADGELASTVDAMLAQLAQAPTRGLAAIKRALYGSANATLEEALADERDLQRELGYSADYREGVDAFLNKRAPNFKGQ
jgi:2-(1,2-epoxy-1,2-dihydrophenyl)acetyl-CoA isomerase